MEIIGNFMNEWVIPNIAYILIVAGVLYLGTFIYSRATGKSGNFKLKNIIAFTAILAIGIYCLITGTDIKDFIH